MKIVLIEPRASGANVYSRIPMPLMGPIYLGTILKQRGHEVEVYNEDIRRPDYSKLNADLIGISILTSTAKRGYEIAKKFPKEKVIIGGVHASLLPEESAQYARQVIVGEADEVISDVVEGRMKDRIVRGKPVHNLDNLPYPDLSLLKGFNPALMITPISTSRGCPFDCNFCSVTKMFGRQYRFRSAENVMGELKLRDTANTIFFCDDNFAAHPKRTHRLLNLMAGNRMGGTSGRRLARGGWVCQVRCDAAKDDELLHLMAKAGCRVVCIGFESINHKTLEAYQKKQTVEEIVSAIRSFHKRKIKIHGMFVLGGDDDNKKTIWDTVRFSIKHKIDTVQMMILTPFPGTKVHHDLDTEKRIFTKDWSLYDGQHIVFNPKLLSARELQLNVFKAYTKFYSLSKSVRLLLKLRIRNALFRFMGYAIIKDWAGRNRKMHWILES